MIRPIFRPRRPAAGRRTGAATSMAVMKVRITGEHAPDLVDEREEVSVALGAALRKLRKAQGLTLRQMTARCGLSQPFLSQIENGKAMPSLLALHHVARALGTTANELLQPQAGTEVSLVRSYEGDVYELTEGAATRFLTSRSARMIEPNEVVFEPGVSTENSGHAGEEFVYILEGRLRVDLEGYDSVELGQGDVYLYPASIRHTLSADDSRACRFLVITSPPSF